MMRSTISGKYLPRLFQLYGRFGWWFKRGVGGLALILVLVLPASASEPLRILVLGDSLSSGYGLTAGQSIPDQLQAAFAGHDPPVIFENAGVAGDTTSGGNARLEWALSSNPDAVIVELGANDALRAIDPALTRRNLDAILAELQSRQLPVLLTGMLAPPNLGTDYVTEFERIFPDLARSYGVLLYPFFLEGVAARPALNQPDGLHPNIRGVAVVVEHILPYVEELIGQIGQK